MNVVQDFAEGRGSPRGTNTSFIYLISKVDNPHNLNDFRLISLVDCMYKIFSKILSNRIIKVLNKVIDYRQSTFLEGRGLMDSVLVAN